MKNEVGGRSGKYIGVVEGENPGEAVRRKDPAEPGAGHL
jgi:hypothetical protein